MKNSIVHATILGRNVLVPSLCAFVSHEIFMAMFNKFSDERDVLEKNLRNFHAQVNRIDHNERT
jgi:hypothetical protein